MIADASWGDVIASRHNNSTLPPGKLLTQQQSLPGHWVDVTCCWQWLVCRGEHRMNSNSAAGCCMRCTQGCSFNDKITNPMKIGKMLFTIVFMAKPSGKAVGQGVQPTHHSESLHHSVDCRHSRQNTTISKQWASLQRHSCPCVGKLLADSPGKVMSTINYVFCKCACAEAQLLRAFAEDTASAALAFHLPGPLCLIALPPVKHAQGA